MILKRILFKTDRTSDLKDLWTHFSAICDTPGSVEHHDGMEGYGDYIFWEVSFGCNQEYPVNIDEYVNDITVSAYGNGQRFSCGLYKDGIAF